MGFSYHFTYFNELSPLLWFVDKAEYVTIGEVIGEIRTEKFPQEKHCYRMREGELEKLKALL